MKHVSKRQIKKLLKTNKTLSVKQFNKLFGTNAKSGDMTSMLSSMVAVNDEYLLPEGARVATSGYYTSFKLSTDTNAIVSYYRGKAERAADRASIARISGNI